VQARAQAASSASQAQASSAQAAVNTAQAGASQYSAQAAQAAVAGAQAQVAQDQLNIDRAVITSPVDGTVIARNVSVGQTVAASFQTPTLFTIAQDLKKMEVDISVGEPDIGNVRAGDAVNFSVLAYPNETFKGIVQQVRENPATVSNVVTYTVITDVDNPQNKLLPGMTANATINVNTARNALVVPTQALSFRPSMAAHKRTRRAGSQMAQLQNGPASSASPWGQTAGGASTSATAGSMGLIFVSQNGKPQPVRVRIDLVSGAQAAVTPLRGALSAGDSVITGSASSGTTRGQSAARSGAAGGPGGMGSIGRMVR
jgi:HlyD family secretion protein